MEPGSASSGGDAPPTSVRRSLNDIPPEELKLKLQELFGKFKTSQQELANLKHANQGECVA